MSGTEREPEEIMTVKGICGGRHQQCLEGLMGPSEKGKMERNFVRVHDDNSRVATGDERPYARARE